MRVREIETLAEFDRVTAGEPRSLRGWHVQSLDLTERTAALAEVDVAGAVFLGCRLAPEATEDVARRGGLIFPAVPAVPFDPYRGRLYTPEELYAHLDEGYPATLDAALYAWSRGHRTLDRTLAASLHDHSIDDALEEFVDDGVNARAMVGIMGGHAVRRGEPAYVAAALLGRDLSSAFTIATGGGPGAMEAANLGAWHAGRDEAELRAAIDRLAVVPDFAPDVTAWARVALEVRADLPAGSESLGVPTWFYGHEPPNAFATVVAKYFRNALREDMLLTLCRRGIVFLPGAAGTVQEIFQVACGNYYADAGGVVPLVFVGREHWTRELPVWPLVRSLAAERAFDAGLHLVDDAEEVLPLLLEEGRHR